MNSSMATNPSLMLTLVPVQVHLPEEIIIEILKRLPVQTLVEFKRVCKSWNRLITDPIFINTHLHSNSPTRLILSSYDNIHSLPLSVPLNPKPNPQQHHHHLPRINGDSYDVTGHCNGLFCLISDGTIILYNPSLSRYRTLPTPSNFYPRREVLGIGYDSSNNDYKIVRVPSSYIKFKVFSYKPEIDVFSLNSNSWRKLPETETPPYFMAHDAHSLYLNGGIYWLTVEDTLIVRFDVSKERFSRVPPPPDCRVSWIGVINHSFCAIFSHTRSYFDIWETHDDLNWKKLITVSKFPDPRPGPHLESLNHYPLCFIETGELLIIVSGSGLMAYDPKEHRYRRFGYRRFAFMEDAFDLQVTVYTDTLVFPPEPLDETGSSFDQTSSSLDQTGSSSSGFTKMLMRFSDAFRNRLTCLSNSSKKL